MKQQFQRISGFTLIEMLVVIVVIAILAGLVGPLVFRNVGDARVSAAKAQMELFGLALDQYRLGNGPYPTPAQGLDALRRAPAREPAPRNWRGAHPTEPNPPGPRATAHLYTESAAANPCRVHPVRVVRA